MVNMTTIREKSQYVLGAFLVIFLLSMTLGGLIGGANIMDLIVGKLYFWSGDDHPQHLSRYAGYVGDEWIERQEFDREKSRQINIQRNNIGQALDGQAIIGAENTAWNLLVERAIQKPIISKLGLDVSQDELFEYILGAPNDLKQYFIGQGLFVDENNNFLLSEYQDAVRSGNFPLLEDQRLNYEASLRKFIPSKKLQELFSVTGSINNQEVMQNYLNNNSNCTIEYSYINSNSIGDSLITVSDNEIEKQYNEDKKDLYKLNHSRTVEYVFWNFNLANIDSSLHSEVRDSINDISYQILDEANVTDLSTAVSIDSEVSLDTMNLTLEYDNLSGVPYKFGANRRLVRFAFDSPIGTVSDIFQVKNGQVICQIVGEKEGSYKSLDDISASIKSTLIRDKKMDYAKSLLEEAQKNALSTAEIANANELIKYESDVSGTLGSSFKSIGSSSTLKGTLKAMEIGETSGIIEVSYNAVIVSMIEKDEFNEDDFAIQKPDLRKELLDGKKYQKYNDRIFGYPLYNEYLTSVKEEIKIVDYRSKIY